MNGKMVVIVQVLVKVRFVFLFVPVAFPACPSSTFTCATGQQCIDLSLRCNGHKDCVGDSSDEDNCPPRNCTAQDEFKCSNSVRETSSLSVPCMFECFRYLPLHFGGR
jgi:hypothetical protein